jgi:hypothetical protein
MRRIVAWQIHNSPPRAASTCSPFSTDVMTEADLVDQSGHQIGHIMVDEKGP